MLVNWALFSRPLACLLLASLGFFGLAVPRARAQGPAAPNVLSVEARGNLRVPSERIVSQSGITLGSPLDKEAVRAGIRRLYGTGQFETIEVFREDEAAGVRIVVSVVENPIVEEVRYEGMKKVKEDDLKGKTTLRAGEIVSEKTLTADAKATEEIYREKGYLLATVSYTVEPAAEGRAQVVFRVVEGQKVRVKGIEIAGLTTEKPDKVRGALKTKPDGIFRSGEFKRDVYEEDKERVVAYLKDRGYADARIVSDSIWTGGDGRDLFIRIVAEEGRPYTYGSISASGSALMSEGKLLAASGLRPGETYSEKDFEAGLGEIYGLFSEEGYIYTNVVPDVEKHDGIFDVKFVVTDGPAAHVRKIGVSGNTKTKEKVIRRELAIYPGDLFRRSALFRSQREVFQLGFFGDVQLKHEAVRGSNDIDLTFEVTERETGQASMGAGFSSQNGATGFVRLGETNLFGNGQRVDVLWEFGNLNQVELSFTEPWLFDTRTTGGFDITLVRRNLDTYYDTRRGAGIRLGRPVPWLDYSRVDWRYRLENRELEPQADASPAVVASAGEDLISSTRVTFYRSSTDRPFHPTSGTTTVLTSELAGGVLGGDIGYHQEEFESRWYFPAWAKMILMLRGRFGMLQSVGHDEVPIYERYRLGGTGPFGLRGYGDRDVVPEGNASDVGGRSMVVLTSEFKYPFAASVFGLVFAEAGNTWNSFHEVRLGELQRGAGVGVRFEIPLLGQLGFDMGYGFDRQDSRGRPDPGWEPHFQLGSLF